VGNTFSLQKEPDVAIRCFQRALQLDPNFTYAHSLSGHEMVSNEDLEKALKCFRSAIVCDDRHYHAWYGIGSIFHRQEKFEEAEYHFRKALAINKFSSVLKCFLSIVLHSQGKNNYHPEIVIYFYYYYYY
jgi:anaphase-promoting complex subunit 3